MKGLRGTLAATALAATALAANPDRGRAQDYFKIDPLKYEFSLKPAKGSEKVKVCPDPKTGDFEVSVTWEKSINHPLQHGQGEQKNTTTYPFSGDILSRYKSGPEIHSPGMGYRGAGHLFQKVDDNTLILFDRSIDGGPVTIKFDCSPTS